EVLRLAAEGLTNREIATRLFLSKRTVDMHVRNVLAKLDCRSRAQATQRARTLQLLKQASRYGVGGREIQSFYGSPSWAPAGSSLGRQPGRHVAAGDRLGLYRARCITARSFHLCWLQRFDNLLANVRTRPALDNRRLRAAQVLLRNRWIG